MALSSCNPLSSARDMFHPPLVCVCVGGGGGGGGGGGHNGTMLTSPKFYSNPRHACAMQRGRRGLDFPPK